jgi:antitoxin component YwqK of YwqJK toxin-antitoxin module
MNSLKYILFICFFLTACNFPKKEYYENGNIKKVYYIKNGQLEGIYKEYDDKGYLKLEGIYKLGKLNGNVKGYNKNNKLFYQVNYKDSLRNGSYKEYSESGKLSSIVTYINGKKEGLLISYYESGKIEITIPYKHGFKKGKGEEYFKSGKLKAKDTYIDDDLVYRLEFNENGDTIEEQRKLLIVFSTDNYKDADSTNEQKRITLIKKDSIEIGKETGIVFLLTGPKIKEKKFFIGYVIYPINSINKGESSIAGRINITNIEPYCQVPLTFIKEGTYIIRAAAVLNKNKKIEGQKVIKVVKG